jgi:hypothetical protein
MAKGFNTRNEDLADKIEKRREENRAKMGGGEGGPRLKVQDGLNVFWVLPGIGDTLEPVNDMLIHYGPFHRCGRTDPEPNPEAEGGYDLDGRFGNCVRCQTAWNTWDDKGRPEGPAKQKFSGDMENHQAVMQVIDFSPFFKLDSTKRFATAQKKAIKKHLDTFLEIVSIDKRDAEGLAEAKELVPDDWEDDMENAALASPGIVRTNKTVGGNVREQWEIKSVEADKDPLVHPDEFLLQIHRTNEGGTFKGRNGQDIKKKDYAVRFTTKSKTKAWTSAVDKDALIELALEVAVDIYNIEPASDSLEDRAYALEKFDDETIEEYLEACDHSYEPELDDDEDDGGELDPDNFDADDFDADDFDDEDVLSTEDHAEAEALKEELADD